MKKLKYLLIIVIVNIISLPVTLKAQVLNVPLVIQEQTNWCWVASSKCVLDYFGYVNAQCTIAEYTRTVATWHNFGTMNCCTDPSQGCNYWNYNWGYAGSIEDILNHFGNLHTNNLVTSLTIAQIQTEINAARPFIFRWGWYSGGGHFLVGHGISGTDMYYMNPLPGYGYEISNYYWVLDDGSSHTWTHTQTLCIPSIPGSITGNTNVCQGSSQTYSIIPVPGATSYTWVLPSTWTGSSNSTSISTTVGSSGGTISVTANNSCGNSMPQTLPVTVNPLPSQPGIISGNTSVCQGSSETYSINSVPGATSYTWTLPAGWSGSSTTTTITATVGSSSGTISVTANNSCGSSIPQTLSVTVNLIPLQPGTISGNNTVCQGSSQTYSVAPVPGATSYTWTIPSDWSGSSTSTSISVTVGSLSGTIFVTANNSCGISPAQTLMVTTVNQTPSQPGNISGNSNVCAGSTQSYSIDPVSGAMSYTWILPSDWVGYSTSTTIIAIVGNLDGTISVTADNSCGNSMAQTLPVTSNTVDTSITVNELTLISNASPATYQWITCPLMQIINGETNQVFSPSQNGSYGVIVTQNGCTDTSSCYSVIVTDITFSDNAVSIVIYPNPTNDLLNIKCSGVLNENYNIILTNTFGEKLNEKVLTSTQNHCETQFEIKEFSSGIYFLIIRSSSMHHVFKVLKR